MKTVFLRALETEDKASALRRAAAGGEEPNEGIRFEADAASFSSIPGSPFAYWVSDALRRLFRELPPFEDGGRMAKLGASTKNDFRFLRLVWEVEANRRGDVLEGFSDSRPWVLFAKGGSFSRYYADIHLLVSWDENAGEIEAELLRKYPYLGTNANFVLHRSNPYLTPGLTWSRRTQSGLSLRALPAGCVFGDIGPSAFLEDDGQDTLLALLSITNSSTFPALVELQMTFGSYEVGVIQRTPVPHLAPKDTDTLSGLAHRAWSLTRSLDTATETSHAFHLPALLQKEGESLKDRASAWASQVSYTRTELSQIQAEIDEHCFSLYGIEGEDRRRIEEGFSPDSGEDGSDEEDERQEDTEEADLPALTHSLISWTLGTAFGRFDVRTKAVEDRASREPDPLAPLPVSSPGMLQDEDGLPARKPPSGYPLSVPEDGVLVDDPGHPRDICARIGEVFRLVFFEDGDERFQEACEILDPRTYDLRPYLEKKFFPLHLKHYSMSRRKAPLYLHLATPSGSYALWLYYPRLTRDTFYRLLEEFMRPKLQAEESRYNALLGDAGTEPTRSQRNALEAQETFLEELRAFRDELERVAPLWDPDLDDGVPINASLLWRLFPQHKSWQKDCRSCFEKLAKGEYDWATLALRLWPERVIEAAHEDRSIAIAHDLEKELWEDDHEGTPAPRTLSDTERSKLAEARVSAKARSALEELLSLTGVGG